MSIDIEAAKLTIKKATRPFFRGRVDIVSGVIVEARGVPAALGELCRIERPSLGPIHAEVVGFRGDSTLLMPHGDLTGIAPAQPVYALGKPFSVCTGRDLLGRMVDGLGTPLDEGPPILATEYRPLRSPAPGPLERRPITDVLQTGVRAIDSMTTLGRGQRLGIFAGSGVGKSTLLGQITRGTNADVVVCCLVGERGREVGVYRDEVLGTESVQSSVMVVATSDRPPIERYAAPFTAVTIAEHFRDQGLDVLLVMDSVTRFAAAAREIGLAAGEPPTVRGYPPSFFTSVPKLVERMGRTVRGSITGLITVLLDGDDEHEPVADTMRGLLDGHVMLSRDLARAGRFPAIDVLGSLSRLMTDLVGEEHRAAAQRIRETLAVHASGRDLIDIGAYRPGANPALDDAVVRVPVIEAFLAQGANENTPLAETLDMLRAIADAGTGEVSA
ncbi:MAG: FliI/YscN family ATPase [bacterium]|nr:FliI/YscN family ATPase [bacterium]